MSKFNKYFKNVVNESYVHGTQIPSGHLLSTLKMLLNTKYGVEKSNELMQKLQKGSSVLTDDEKDIILSALGQNASN